ncbi:MAG: single-stranded-DNA-specific exonuclease RecJ [Clostridia bacterium]|nr:single-stranded-DNA-specific exonuclease RecJ [Clostridia bacterium]
MNEIRRERVWSLLYQPDGGEKDQKIAHISKTIGVSPITARLLYNRGYDTPQKAYAFVNTDISVLHDPYLMKDMDKAVARISQAIKHGEIIAIYGDYDVDGVTSVTSIYLYLKSKGADVVYYIPSRDKEGYGLCNAAIDVLAEHGVGLIITVDTGITADTEVQYAASLGVDMVITDHHECRAVLPDACAVVNPHRSDCPYPFKELAGVGVVFKLICAYEIYECRQCGGDEKEAVKTVCKDYVDLTAIGTIADVMPIIDENRYIVSIGLAAVEHTERCGLNALIEASSYNPNARQDQPPKRKKITSGFIGYGIAPRINAAGRISSALKAVELLLEQDPEIAKERAEELCAINTKRQIEENRIAEQAYRTIEQEHDFVNDRVIVLQDDSWQQGIIGIVSSRITEKFGLPSVLISFDGATRGYASMDDVGKGSGRSIKGMNLVDALTYCSDLLTRYGGHELAAGLSISRCNIDEFKKRINQYARENLDSDALDICYEADCEVDVTSLTMPLATELAMLEPFGVANPTPELVTRNLTIYKVIPLGAGKHCKVILAKDGLQMQAVWFGVPASTFPFSVSDCVDVMFQLSINEYQNVKSLQLIVKDMRISDDYAEKCKWEKERYQQIMDGAVISPSENVIPNREDIAEVYKLLRSQCRIGHNTFSHKTLLSTLNMTSALQINYIKLKYIIHILKELNLCGVKEPSDNLYIFDVYYNAAKTNIENSEILKRLRAQCR